MILGRALGRPRASAAGRSQMAEDVQQMLRRIFKGMEEDASRSAAETLSPVAAAHRILTNSFGLIPFGVYCKEGDARHSVADDALEQVLKWRPNPRMSPFVCGKILLSNAFWWGFGACWNRRDETGQVVERIPLPSDCCSIRRDSQTGLYWYDYSVEGVSHTFASYDLSFLYFETYDGVHGRGMMHLAREAVAADAMAQRYGKKFYQNGARLSGIVEVDTDASKETRDRVKGEFAQYAADDAFKVAVLDHSMKYTPLGISQSDAQFIESRTFTVEEISRFSGIPKYMLQSGKEAYNSNAQQRIDYVTDTLVPFVTQWEQENTYKLLGARQREAGWYIKGNVSVLLRGDDTTRSQFYERMVRNSIYCPDECRALEEKDPIPGGLGRQFFVSKNMGSLETVLKGGE